MTTDASQHWQLARDDEGIAWLSLGHASAATNVLSTEVLEQFGSCLDELEHDAPKGLVILSAKTNGFIAGADVREIAAVEDYDTALTLVKRVQSLFDRLEAVPFTTVAAISGFCLGGGMELALACRYRVVEETPATRLGLPEVMLGFHPGWGGTVRLTRLIGAPAALDLMLSGRSVDARTAKRLGLADAAVPHRHLKRAARILLHEQPAPRQPKWWLRAANLPLARDAVALVTERQVAKRARKEHYPAPYAIVDLWRRHGGDWREMMDKEAPSAAQLAMTSTARNLIRLFFLRERLTALGKQTSFPLRHAHVVGAGTMGGDIAAWCALKGYQATLQDQSAEKIAPAIARAAKLFRRKLKEPHRVQNALDRLVPDLGGHGVGRADLVIEAIVEDLAVKQALFEVLEKRAPQHALLATNTSSIPLEEIATGMQSPQRLVGLHFFNPVAKMQLVEVVHKNDTPSDVLEKALAVVKQLDRLPLPVKSSPGFLVNRVLMPYLMEAVELVNEGIEPETVDAAAKHFGMPLGPVEFADTVGLDICLSVAQVLTKHYGGAILRRLEEMVEKGRLGSKSGQGFYNYTKGRRSGSTHVKTEGSLDELAERMILRLVNEARACLEEGVVESADLLDAGMVFGTGFAPFRGGVMHYVDQRGQEAVERKLAEFSKRFGERFEPRWGATG